MKNEVVIVLDFGGQYNQLIARRVRECNVYCEIYSYKTDIEKIKAMQPKGIIFTGGPNSVYLQDSPTYTKEIFELGIPVLGICYGSQLMMHLLGGKVEKAPVREYGKIEVTVNQNSKLFENVSAKTICWMSHNDYISQIAPGLKSALIQQIVRLQLLKIQKRIYMQHSSIRKYFIARTVRRCCATSWWTYAVAARAGAPHRL